MIGVLAIANRWLAKELSLEDRDELLRRWIPPFAVRDRTLHVKVTAWLERDGK
jgi:hypothetical protein